MNTEKLKGILGCIGIIALFMVLLLMLGLSFKIVPPIKTWRYTIQIWCMDRESNEGDSVYLACLNQKADIFEKKGHDKRCLNARKKILDYYVDKGDSLSVDYAMAKYKYYLANEDGLLNLKDVEYILLRAWEKKLLNEEEKEMLCRLLWLHTNNGSLIHKADEPIYLKVLEIARTMCHSPAKEGFLVTTLTALVTIYMRDLQDIDKVTHYITLLNNSVCEEKVTMVMRWLLLTRYYLLTHNSVKAQECLDAAKDIRYKDKDITIFITQLQKAIYEATGDVAMAIDERRHIVALDNSPIAKHLLRWENAIILSRKYQARYYESAVNNDIDRIIEETQTRDSLTNDEKVATRRYFIQAWILGIEHALKFTNEDPTPALIELSQWNSLLPDEQLKIINLSIQSSLKYPSDSSKILLQNGINALHQRLRYTFPHFTDGEKASFWMAEEPVLRQIYAANGLSNVKYNIALLSKGLLLESSNNIKRSIMESQDSSLIRDWHQLQMLRQTELLNIEQDQQHSLISIQYRADSLERSISQRSTAYQHFKNTWDITWTDVQSQLGENECAIEIVSYPIHNDIQYDALIVRKHDSIPACIHIGRESSYKGIGATELYTKRSSLIDTIWTPLLHLLPSGNIYISMDGWFHKNNIEAMVADEKGHLLSDLYSIVRVSSTRNLVQSSNLSMQNAILFGGVKYDVLANEYILDTIHSTIGTTNRGFVFSKNRKKNLQFDYLPYTLEEVKDIASLLKEHGCDATLYISNQANERVFKSISGSGTQILHISTHGIADQTSDGSADPMRYCCLLLAGANNALSHQTHTDWTQDGVLTASEISALDFRGMELVVLSACNTAGGEITSEGVFGLQRAFKQAGAQSILMSLANIDDQVTSQFMIEYYAQLVNGFDKRTALARTRNIIRKKNPGSIDWAAFILMD